MEKYIANSNEEKNMPREGSIIKWFGTKYKCLYVENDIVWVAQNNSIRLPLWWSKSPGCVVVKY